MWRHEQTKEDVKMSQTTAKTWCLRLLPVLVFFISFVIYYYFYAILRSFGGPSKNLSSSKSLCGGWLTQKKWESLNFNISRQTQLFLKLEDFFWREHLSTLPLPYGIKGSELLLLKVLAISSNYHVPAKIENLGCRTCAVIGNGFAIKNSSLGSIINKHDVVIRLNDAPVRGYEEDVGNKTTMRFFYPESASYNPALHNDPDTLMVLVPFKQQDLRWLKEIIYDEKRVRKGFWKPPPQIWLGDVSKIRVLDPHFLLQTADKLLKILSSQKEKQVSVHPTTGILAVYVALNYCDVVHIAGFGYPSSNNPRQLIHYYGYDTMKSMKNSYHDLNHEAKALKKLEDSGAIFYLHPHL
ncbi:CMP-N-acetylneuraminate-beta-galactosamide-alpha-2,3-sialyltransferase 4 [Gambusia affinis]|uniref:CMP-N-acetylneuraminate-beta-galactosamide- alpha-2,3-sialyltransferase 4 n=1 Tax=Gambusia affinis TaxID=33528 RepID=UPI000F32EEA7|nr:CMP-N-acetylneuraminate-beta-galactosamide-alpha-2,3-sialyltransferase 4 [Gambusia affinis]XP_043974563.1 CMP-N-acetylneuraminate-beta-galactosamide-alpha-2,3-sialyltransferase 4 [Gambusia affinis]